jgi:SAM-dependent methyltransferase
MRAVLAESGAKSILDAGCGPASFLRELVDTGMELYGFDLTPEMVLEGQRVFANLGLPPERIWEGSVLDRQAFRDPQNSMTGRFDAAVCSGVLPHIPEAGDLVVIQNLHDAVRPGGLVVVEARNALFALFTLNRYSFEFFRDVLIRPGPLSLDVTTAELNAIEDALDRLQEIFRMDLPPVRTGDPESPGYDEVLSRTHNPFELKQQFKANGFTGVRTLFYHYHCLPPMLAESMGDSYRRKSIQMEDPEDWRGHFMASAFIITGKRE